MTTSPTGKSSTLPAPSRIEAGFSLLELIIAIAILSIGITAAIQAVAYSARAAGLSCDMIDASFLALDKMQEAEYKEAAGLLINEPQETDGIQGKFSWKRALHPDKNPDLYKINFEINWKRQNKEEGFTLETSLKK
jgi:general secretion pathway protein I